jgi:tetratricopeptide (TPR) repeat protein
MPALFIVATLALWLRGRRSLAYLSFAAAIWSKEQAIAVPLLAAWADGLGLPPGAPDRRAGAWLRRMLPFALVTIAYLLVRGAVVPRDAGGDEFAARLAAHWSAHPLAPLEAGLFLLQSVFAPRAALAYEPALETWLSTFRAVVAIGAFVLLVALAGTTGVRRAVIAFWIGWMPLAMLLNANLLPLEAPFAERYLWVSSLGVAALGASLGDRLARRDRARSFAIAAGLAVVAALAVTTVHRSRYYRDEIAFGRQWVATSPGHANAHATLGAALARVERDDEAIEALREAVRLEPALAAAHYNLGVTLARRGRSEEAIAAFEAALRAWSDDADAHLALGVLLARRGARDAAIAHLRQAVRLRPGFEEALTALRAVEAPPR